MFAHCRRFSFNILQTFDDIVVPSVTNRKTCGCRKKMQFSNDIRTFQIPAANYRPFRFRREFLRTRARILIAISKSSKKCARVLPPKETRTNRLLRYAQRSHRSAVCWYALEVFTYTFRSSITFLYHFEAPIELSLQFTKLFSNSSVLGTNFYYFFGRVVLNNRFI